MSLEVVLLTAAVIENKSFKLSFRSLNVALDTLVLISHLRGICTSQSSWLFHFYGILKDDFKM